MDCVKRFQFSSSSPPSLLLLHYDVPPNQCNWEFEKCTKHYKETYLSNYQREWVQSCLQSFYVVDIPPLVLSRLGAGHPRVYMEQSVDAFRSIIQHHISTTLLSTRQFLSQLPFLVYNINHQQPTTQSDIIKNVLAMLQIPSAVLRSTFQQLWNAIRPNPSISLSHPIFTDDYYLRVQERAKFCEMIMALFIAHQMRLRGYEAVSEEEVGNLCLFVLSRNLIYSGESV